MEIIKSGLALGAEVKGMDLSKDLSSKKLTRLTKRGMKI